MKKRYNKTKKNYKKYNTKKKYKKTKLNKTKLKKKIKKTKKYRKKVGGAKSVRTARKTTKKVIKKSKPAYTIIKKQQLINKPIETIRYGLKNPNKPPVRGPQLIKQCKIIYDSKNVLDSSNNWITTLINEFKENYESSLLKDVKLSIIEDFEEYGDIPTTLGETPQYIQTEDVNNFIEDIYKDSRYKYVFKQFILKARERSPITYYNFKRQENCKDISCINIFCINDFYNDDTNEVTVKESNENNNVSTLNIFGGEPTNLSKDTIKNNYGYVMAQYITSYTDYSVKYTNWEPNNVSALYNLIKDYRIFVNDDDKKKTLKLLMIFDNIHDFGKSRKKEGRQIGYIPRTICGSNTCMIETIKDNYLTNKINEIKSNDNYPFTDFSANNFGSNWEIKLLSSLIKEDENQLNRLFVIMTKQEIAEYISINNNKVGWTYDTIGPQETKLKNMLNRINPGHFKKLNTSIFDGNVTVTPIENRETKFQYMSGLTIPMTYNDGDVYYFIDANNNLRRNFHNYDEGGTNKKECTTMGNNDCPYERADTVQNNFRLNPEDVNNHVNEFKNYLELLKAYYLPHEPKDNTFFMNIKSLGDLAQLYEAKERNIILITQDSMQFIVGAMIGTKVVKKDPGTINMVTANF